MTEAFAHGAIFFIRDYNPEQNEDNVLARMLEHKAPIKYKKTPNTTRRNKESRVVLTLFCITYL